MRENKDEETYNNYFINIAFPIIRYMRYIFLFRKIRFIRIYIKNYFGGSDK